MSQHWSNQNIIDRLYGVGPDDSHLGECEQCRARWLQAQARRSSVLSAPEVSPEFLLDQRQTIRERIEGRPASGWAFRLAPAMAATCVVVLGLVLSKPAPPPQPTLASADAEFFSEIYSMVESPEPWVAEPMYGLFEDD